MRGKLTGAALLLAGLLAPSAALASAPGEAVLDGARLGLGWATPFVGLLLSIALGPQLAPKFWHRHFGKVAGVWAMAFVLPLLVVVGWGDAFDVLLHVALLEYLPFIILLFALFVIAGGVNVRGNLGGTPLANTGLLAFGAMLASVAGTTGASMLLVRPLIQGNARRPHNAHVLVFFIFLVANIGGALTPVGDPPLFLGFLRGVDFGWTVRHMFAPFLLCAGLVLAIFYAVDRWFWVRDGGGAPPEPDRFSVNGAHNLLYLALAVSAVLVSGVWKPAYELHLFSVHLALQNLVRDLALVSLAGLSWLSTPRKVRIENAFTWEPLAEVIWLFAGIFVTIIPVLAILKAGTHGALAPVVAVANGPGGVPRDAVYFWVAGLLSSFLDNAPTYLVFFDMAGGNAQQLMGPLAPTLVAISCGAVFMGALTYVGNAPNFMVRSIAKERGVRMPSFFGYVAWSAAVLLPVFALLTFVFFHPGS